MRLAPLVAILLALGIGRPADLTHAADPPLSLDDQQMLKAAGLETTGPGLLEFLRERIQGKANREQIASLIGQLADKAPAVRDRAAAQLLGLGVPAVPLLRQAANELDDADAAARARRCLQGIEGSSGSALTSAVVRSLATLKPAGTVQALLAYLPLAEDAHVLEELAAALNASAIHDGQLDSELIKALADPVPLRRAIVAEVLSQVDGARQRQALRPLLQDSRPSVRLRAGLALAHLQEPDAVPVLIGLLSELPPSQTQLIDEFLTTLAGEWSVTVPSGTDPMTRRLRRELWSAWWQATDGPALLEEIRHRTPSDTDRKKIQTLVQALGDANAANRDKALMDLLALGTTVAPFLRHAASERESRVAEQAQKALQILGEDAPPPLPLVVPRLLALRRPAGTVEALLAYLPSAEDEEMIGEVWTALAAQALKEGQPDPVLLKALEDAAPERRAAAAEALCLAGAAKEFPAVRKLLRDTDVSVRCRVALALSASQDREAVPVLIKLLAEMPAAQAGQVEDSLRVLAGETAPDVFLGENEASRKQCREAWVAWWTKNSDKINLARLDIRQQSLGYTLVVEQYDPMRRTGRVVEFDQRGRVRWQVEGLMAPSDAQVLPGDRLLVCEQNANRVTERDFKGKVLWEKPMNQPVGAQRLANGHTLLIGRGQIVEVDHNGKEVFNYSRPTPDIICGKKLRNGHIVFVSNTGMCIRLDAAGKEQKTIHVAPIQIYNGYADVLPNDHVVVPQYQQGKVVEYNPQGQTVWEASISRPICARRLPNGNTLIASDNPPRVVELDRAGKTVWENKEPVRPIRADRR